jgi:hypothetical protein
MKCIACGKEAAYSEKTLFGTRKFGVCNRHVKKYLETRDDYENAEFSEKTTMVVEGVIIMVIIMTIVHFSFKMLVYFGFLK